MKYCLVIDLGYALNTMLSRNSRSRSSMDARVSTVEPRGLQILMHENENQQQEQQEQPQQQIINRQHDTQDTQQQPERGRLQRFTAFMSKKICICFHPRTQ